MDCEQPDAEMQQASKHRASKREFDATTDRRWSKAGSSQHRCDSCGQVMFTAWRSDWTSWRLKANNPHLQKAFPDGLPMWACKACQEKYNRGEELGHEKSVQDILPPEFGGSQQNHMAVSTWQCNTQ